MPPKAGVTFTETMSGTWTGAAAGAGERAGAPPADERPFSFTATARVELGLAQLLEQRASLEGTVRAEGLASDRPLRGRMIIAPLTRGIIRYEFDFSGDDGKPYRFAGQKDVRLHDLLRSMTTLPGAIADGAGVEVGRATVRFDLQSDLVKFLASFRPQVTP